MFVEWHFFRNFAALKTNKVTKGNLCTVPSVGCLCYKSIC